MENLSDKIAVVGIGESEYTMRKNTKRGAKELVIEAVREALDDAGLTSKDIDGVIGGYRATQLFPHTDMAFNVGIDYRFHGALGDLSSSNSSSFLLAAMAIATGQADTVLTYYTNGFGSAPLRLWGPYGPNLLGYMKDNFETPYGNNEQLMNYGQVATRYMHEYGFTGEQLTRQLGAIAVDHRHKALLNGKGVTKKPLSFEDYLNSPMVATPLRRDDCCVLTDGACAWIMTSAERAKDLHHRPVYVTGIGYARTPQTMANAHTQDARGYFHRPHEPQSLDRSLRMAGMSRDDLDFAEIYDAYTIMLLTFLESYGFCKKGEGGAFVQSGAIGLDGSLPVNTHGGHLSHSYLNGASHTVEAIKQLRGEAGACQVKEAKTGLLCVGTIWENYAIIFRRG